MVPSFNTTNSLRSIPILILLAMIPLFISSVIVYYIVSVLSGMPIVTGFASTYLSTLQGFIATLDSIIIFTFAAGIGGIILRSFRITAHPIFAIVGLIGLPILLYTVAMTSNIYSQFTQISILTNALNQYPLTAAFFNNSVLITAAVAILIIFIIIGRGALSK